jgi:hypothetical protein
MLDRIAKSTRKQAFCGKKGTRKHQNPGLSGFIFPKNALRTQIRKYNEAVALITDKLVD